MEIRRILCPVDFSDTSSHAFDYAIELASRFGAELHLVHAYQLPAYALPDGAFVATPEFAARVADESQQQLNKLVESHASSNLKFETHLVEGVAHAEIVRVAKEMAADLIVMGTHGRSGITHFLLGSVAERVVRSSMCPVLTVRKPD